MEGTVEKVSITPSTQPGWSDMVKILVAGIWYDVPGKAPRPAVGAAISFEAEQNQKGYWKARNIILTGSPTMVSRKNIMMEYCNRLMR